MSFFDKWSAIIKRMPLCANRVVPGDRDERFEQLLQVLRNDWWPERSLNSHDQGERRLHAAMLLAVPEEIHTRQKCDCGDLMCEECLDDSAVPDLLLRAEWILDPTMSVRAGDTFYHRPTGSLVKIASIDGAEFTTLCWMDSRVKIAHCDLVHRCTDDEHHACVAQLAALPQKEREAARG